MEFWLHGLFSMPIIHVEEIFLVKDFSLPLLHRLFEAGQAIGMVTLVRRLSDRSFQIFKPNFVRQ